MKRHWKGLAGGRTIEEKAKDADRLRRVVQEGAGDSGKGKGVFQMRCAACHKLFGEGGSVGPELTGYERGNIGFWVDNIVYPSLEIREGYANYTARLQDGRLLVGMLDGQGPNGIVLRDFSGQKTSLRNSEVVSLEASPVSVMPEGLLEGLGEQELRDLFSFLAAPSMP
jgi:putative heme-binding domain-containing protein